MQCFKIQKSNIHRRLDVDYNLPMYQKELLLLSKSKYKLLELGQLCTKITDGTHSTPKYVESGVKFISVKDIKENQIDFENTKYITIEEHQELIKRCKPEQGDILLTKVGTIGNACVIPEGVPDFSIFVSVALLKPNKTIINPYYLQICLSSNFAKIQMKRELKGIGVPDLHLENIAKIKIPVPETLEEQEQFVIQMQQAYENKEKKEQEAQKILDSVNDTILEYLNIKNYNVDSKKTFSVCYKDVKNKRLDVYGYQPVPRAVINAVKQSKYKETIVPLNKIIIENFSGDWGVDIEDNADENYSICNVIRNKNFNNVYNIDYKDIAKRKILNSKKEKIILKKGDILIEKSGGSPQQPVGRVAYIDNDIENYTFSNFLQCIRINTELCHPEYLFIYLRTIYKLNYMKYIQSQTTGIINLLIEDFLNIPIILLKDKKAQKEIIDKYNELQIKAKQLQREANQEFLEAKTKVEKMILGED